MTIITCGLMKIEMMYSVLMALFFSLSLYTFYYLNNNGIIKDDFWSNDRYIFSVVPLLGQLLNGIIEIIRRGLKPNDLSQERYSTDSYMLGIRPINDDRISKKWLIGALVFIVSLLNTSVIVFQSIYLISNKEFLWLFVLLKMIKIVFTALMNKCMLSSINHRHHYLSLFILVIGLGIIIAIEIKAKYEIISNNGNWTHIFIIVIAFSNSFQQILEKQLIDQYFMPQYLLCSLEGLVGIVLIIIAITSFGTKLTLLIHYLTSYSYIFVMFILLFQCVDIFRILTIQRLSPLHQSISDSLTIFFMLKIFFMYQEIKSNILFICLDVFAFGLLMIGYVIYNDIIILYICNLDKYTSKELKISGDAYKKKLVDPEENYTIAGFLI